MLSNSWSLDRERASQHMTRTSSARQTRISGLLVGIGAAAFIIHIVLRSLLTAGEDPAASAQSAAWLPVNALGAVAATMVLFGMPAVHARLASFKGQAGIELIAASWLFFGLFLSLYGALILPWLAREAPSLVAASAETPMAFIIAFAMAQLAWLLGAVLLAWSLMKSGQTPRWVSCVLIASAAWALIGGFVIAPDGPASNVAVNLLSNMGPVLLLLALGYLGYQEWEEHDGTA